MYVTVSNQHAGFPEEQALDDYYGRKFDILDLLIELKWFTFALYLTPVQKELISSCNTIQKCHIFPLILLKVIAKLFCYELPTHVTFLNQHAGFPIEQAVDDNDYYGRKFGILDLLID